MNNTKKLILTLITTGLLLSIINKQTLLGNIIAEQYQQAFPHPGLGLISAGLILFLIETYTNRTKNTRGGLEQSIGTTTIWDTSALITYFIEQRNSTDTLRDTTSCIPKEVYHELLHRKETETLAEELLGTTTTYERKDIQASMMPGARRINRGLQQQLKTNAETIPTKIVDLARGYIERTPKAQLAYLIPRFLEGNDIEEELEASGLDKEYLKEEIRKIGRNTHQPINNKYLTKPETMPTDTKEAIQRELRQHYEPSRADTEVLATAIIRATNNKENVTILSNDKDLKEALDYTRYGVDSGINPRTGETLEPLQPLEEHFPGRTIGTIRYKEAA